MSSASSAASEDDDCKPLREQKAKEYAKSIKTSFQDFGIDKKRRKTINCVLEETGLHNMHSMGKFASRNVEAGQRPKSSQKAVKELITVPDFPRRFLELV